MNAFTTLPCGLCAFLARKQVGGRAFDAAWRKGREMEADHALKLALGVVTSLAEQQSP